MGKNKSTSIPQLHFTDKNCRLGDKERPGIGLLLNENLEPIIPVSDYLIHMTTENSSPLDTRKEIARELRMFWEYLSRRKVDWCEVGNRLLSEWRDDMRTGVRISSNQKAIKGGGKNVVKPIGSNAINRRLSFVFQFYKWSKEHGHVPDHLIGVPGDGRRYQITAKIHPDTKEWQWPYTLPFSIPGKPNIPTPDDIDKLHDEIDELFGPIVARRNRLAAEWMNQTGLRGKEVVSIKVSMIPEEDEIYEFINKEEKFSMPFSPSKQGVETKYDKDRPIGIMVDPTLLLDIRRYIDFERVDLIAKLKKKSKRRLKEPQELFLTVEGKPLKKKTLQNELGKAFKSAGIKASPHGLRKAFAMRTVFEVYTGLLNKHKGDTRKVDLSTVITYVRLLLGHSTSRTTIENYLDIVKLKLMGMPEIAKQAFLSERKESSNRALRLAEKKLKAVETKLEGLTGDVAEGLSGAISDGLLDALGNGDQEKVFHILNQNLNK